MTLIISLIILGIILLLVEIVLLPGVTIAGVFAFISFGGSVYFAFDQYGMMAGFIVAGAILVISIVAIILALRSKMWDKLALNQNVEGSIDKLPTEVGVKIGDVATTLTRLNPVGTLTINNKSYEGKSLNALIDQGVSVEVIGIENSQIIVKKIDATIVS